jgi:hypothetical protein
VELIVDQCRDTKPPNNFTVCCQHIPVGHCGASEILVLSLSVDSVAHYLVFGPPSSSHI